MSQNNYYDSNSIVQLFDGAPIKLWWHGWASTTHDLKRQGWSIHASQNYRADYDAQEIRLAARCPDKRMLITGVKTLGMREMMEFDRGVIYSIMEGFRMQSYHTERDMVQTMGVADWNSYERLSEVDVYEPTQMSIRDMQRNFRDLRIFKEAEPLRETKEIYIPLESVDECLNRILELQWPEAKDNRGKLIMPEAKPIITAQILTLAS